METLAKTKWKRKVIPDKPFSDLPIPKKPILPVITEKPDLRIILSPDEFRSESIKMLIDCIYHDAELLAGHVAELEKLLGD